MVVPWRREKKGHQSAVFCRAPKPTALAVGVLDGSRLSFCRINKVVNLLNYSFYSRFTVTNAADLLPESLVCILIILFFCSVN